MFIFFAASPIGSLLRIFVLVFEYFYPTSSSEGNNCLRDFFASILPPHHRFPIPNDDGDIEIPKGIASYFYTGVRRNITADDIMHTVFHHHAMPIHSLYPLNPVWSRSSENLNQDLKMVLPWIFAFTTIIIVPLSLIVFNALWRRSDMETSFRTRKIQLFQLCLQGYQKKITAEDIISNVLNKKPKNDNNDNNGRDDTDAIKLEMELEESTIVMLPKPGVAHNPAMKNTKTQLRQVTGTCAICLSCYKEGETVVWSSFSECNHVFHKSCIVTWIQKRYTSSCPCCRRGFIDSELYNRMKHSHHVKSKFKQTS
jgi:hypothetical protein